MKGISRHPDGWLVRVYRNGETFGRLLGYKSHKLTDAKKYLALLEEELPKSNAPRIRTAPQKNSTSGVSGVSFSEVYSKRTKKKYPSWQVHYKKGDMPTNKRFYFSHYKDHAEALSAAKAFRLSYEKSVA